MANFKHKVFLLIAKWIPVAVAAGILINNTLAMLDVKDVILDLFDITVGSSLIAESNKKLELFEKFQIAAKANPNLTYKEFCESINK